MDTKDTKPPAPEAKPAKAAKPDATETEILAKMRAGLTRAQACEVLETQAAHDAAMAKGKGK